MRRCRQAKKAPCARIEQILKTSRTIKTASGEQQERQSEDNYGTLLADEYSQNWSSRKGGSHESGQLDSSGESSEGEETDNEYKSDAPDSEDDSNDVVLAFIASDEEYADERPATTRSGRAATRRAETDFSFF